MNQTSFSARVSKFFRDNARLGTLFTVLIIAVVIVFNTVIFGMANKFTWYFAGVTELKHEIGEGTDAYLAEVAGRGDVNIIFCDSPDALEADSVYNLVWQTANQFALRHDFVKVSNVNIFTDPDRVEKFKYATDSETGEKTQINAISASTVIFEAEDDFAVLPMQSFFVLDSEQSITSYTGEEVTAAMIHRVLTPDTRPTAYFTESHGETYSKSFMNRLICGGYAVKTIDLMASELTDEEGKVGKGDVLVVSNPRYDFVRGSAEHGIIGELDKMDAFLAAGGSVIAMLDPLVTNTIKLEEFLTTWGITVSRVENDTARYAISIRDTSNSVTTDGYALISEIGESGIAAAVRTQMAQVGAGRVIISHASPITLTQKEGKTVSSLLASSSSAKSHANGEVVDDKGNYTIAAISRDNKSGGSVFAVSSVYLTAEDALTSNEYGNRDLIYCIMEEMCGVSMPMGGSHFMFDNNAIEDLTMWEARLWTVVLAALLPAAIAVSGVVILIKRRCR